MSTSDDRRRPATSEITAQRDSAMSPFGSGLMGLFESPQVPLFRWPNLLR